MSKEYIEERDGGYYIAGTRISLDSVVHAFRRGVAPESIRLSYPLLTLEEVYGAIAYYLAHQEQVDAYLKEQEARYERERQAAREADPEFYSKFDEIRQGQETPRR
jgi:uncharacterized protein (DUF433 family)